MFKKAAGKAMRLVRGMALFGGAAVTLALILGVGTAALAAVPGDPFRLGQVNLVNNAITSLVGTRAGGAMMLVDNNSAAAGSRALDLRAEAGRAPLTVNPEAGKAPNLDADQLDGKDSGAFLSAGKIYIVEREAFGSGNGSLAVIDAACDGEDPVLGGGGLAIQIDDKMTGSFPTGTFSDIVPDGWRSSFQDQGGAGRFRLEAICADFPPLRNP